MRENLTRIDANNIQTDALAVEEGELENVIEFLRTQAIPSDPHIRCSRFIIETEDTTIEITASDDAVEIREIRDDTSD